MTNYQTDPAHRTSAPRTDYVPPATSRRDASNAALYAGLLAILAVVLIAWFAPSREPGDQTPATNVDVTTESPAVAPASPPATEPDTSVTPAPATPQPEVTDPTPQPETGTAPATGSGSATTPATPAPSN